MHIGFVGAGYIGEGLARLAVAAGHTAMISNSRGPDTLRDLAASIGAEAVTAEQAARRGDMVVLTVPFTRVFELDAGLFADRIVMDTNNYYPTRDGQIAELDTFSITTSEMVQRHLPGARVVKAFNAILARDLEPPFGLPEGRRALPIAGDDQAALDAVSEFHRSIGFDTLAVGPLSESWRFERAKPAYCIPLDLDSLRTAIDAAEREVELPHNSWYRDN